MPIQLESAARHARADPYAPTPALLADARAFAHALARVWPRPHAGYFALPAERRHLARLISRWGEGEFARLPEAMQFWALRRIVTTYLPATPDGLTEALRKLDGDGWEREDYAKLLDVLKTPEGTKVLRHAVCIDVAFVRTVAALPAALRRPRILAHVAHQRTAELVARSAKRAHPTMEPRALTKMADRLERAGSGPHLFRMLIDEIGLEQLAPPPMPGADWLKPLASSHDLHRAALRFENCLKYRVPLLLLGRGAYYEVVGDEPAVVEIVRDGNGLWVIGEVRGHANAPISPALYGRVRAHLDTHGVQRGQPDALSLALADAAGW